MKKVIIILALLMMPIQTQAKVIDMGTFKLTAFCPCESCSDNWGRQTYMPDLVRDIIRPHLKELSDKDLGVMIQDCEFQKRMDLYGDPGIDKPGWIQWKEELLKEKQRREQNETD